MNWECLREAFYRVRRIGIVRTDHLGDMVLTLPMVPALRQLRPEVEIILFAHSRTAPLLLEQPEITAAVFVDQLPGGLLEAFRRWRAELVFFPRPVFQEVLAAWRAGVRYRVGSGYRWYSLLFSHRIYEHRRDARRHEAEYNVQMVASAAGVPMLPVRLLPPKVPQEARHRVEQLLQQWRLLPRSFVVVHPGGRGSAPRWAPESFAMLCCRLEEEGIPCVVTGSREEAVVAERIQRQCRQARLACGQTTLPEFIALLGYARVVVANSTGAVHIAAALGVPVVGLYSRLPAHHPRRWGPYTERAHVLVPPPEAPPDAVEAIPVEEVYRAVLALWGAEEGRQPRGGMPAD